MNKTQEVRALVEQLRDESFLSRNEELLMWEIDKLNLAIEVLSAHVKRSRIMLT